MMFRVYRNLTKGNWTIQHKTDKGWRKYDSTSSLWAPHVEFIYSEAGRQRVRWEKRKNVHAFAVVPEYFCNPAPVRYVPHFVTYNPYDDRVFRVVPESRYTPWNVLRGAEALFMENGQIGIRTLLQYRSWDRPNGYPRHEV